MGVDKKDYWSYRLEGSQRGLGYTIQIIPSGQGMMIA